MKLRIFVAAVLIFAAAVAGRWVSRVNNPHVAGRDETRQTYRLDAGAHVEVRGINGSVEIKTADTDTADVRVVRTGDCSGESGSVTVEGSASGVEVRGEKRGGRGFLRWLWGGGAGVRYEVTLVVPRRVDVVAKGINGPVSIGEVDGPVGVEGVNGRVEVAGSTGRAGVQGVNGQVRLNVTRLDAGMEIKGVNGNVEVRFRELPNADLDVKGNNGGLTLNLPNVTSQERRNFSSMRARIGSGGARIVVKGVNGHVRFESDAPASAAAVNSAPPAPAAPADAPDTPDEEDFEAPQPPPAPSE